MKRAMVNMTKPDVPANDLPLLPPDADIEPKSVLRHAILANRELARLKGLVDGGPRNQLLDRHYRSLLGGDVMMNGGTVTCL